MKKIILALLFVASSAFAKGSSYLELDEENVQAPSAKSACLIELGDFMVDGNKFVMSSYIEALHTGFFLFWYPSD